MRPAAILRDEARPRRAPPHGLALLGVGLLAGGLSACGCGDETACTVPLGQYHAFGPEGWDGRGRLPVVVSAHGYGGDAAVVYERDALRRAFSRAGVLWVVPEGVDGTWNVPGTPGSGRDEAVFLRQVLDDAAAQFGADPERAALGGFSLGGSLAHGVGCLDPAPYSHLLPVSGTFWDPSPTSCRSGLPVRHTHGTADETWPLEGRRFDDTWAQGTVDDARAAWVATGGCTVGPVEVEEDGQTCAVWSGCATGEVWVCLHDGGHRYLDDEAPRQLRWLEEQGFFG